MSNYRTVLRFCAMACALAAAMAVPSGGTPQKSAPDDEQAIWNKERAYWRYVEQNDLTAYRNLWHKDFLGWPSVSAVPLGKEHITDWITAQTGQGRKFKAAEFKPAAIHVTGNVAVAYYRITFAWLDKDGKGTQQTSRITHTWLKDGGDWLIIGGMSAPEPAVAPKQ